MGLISATGKLSFGRCEDWVAATDARAYTISAVLSKLLE